MALTRKKKIVFALIAMTISFAGMILLLLAADLVLHARAEKSAGLNRYGYRGPVVGRKQPGELRVAMLGGSTVFGYGVAWNESIPAFLEEKLRARLNRPVHVFNLGFNNQGAFAFVPDLEDFAYLDYDVVVLYEGYNDLSGDAGPNRNVYRRDSAIYRMLGYYPILPLYLDEKAKSIRFGSNNMDAAYEDMRRKQSDKAHNQRDNAQTVFTPGLAQRTGAAALETIASMTKALDGQLQESTGTPPPAIKETESTLGCTSPYVTYCESIAAAVRYALARGKGVVVGSQPAAPGNGPFHERHTKQHEVLTSMMTRVFGSEPHVAWADAFGLLDLTSVDVSFDGMHLKPEANAAIAAALVDHVLKVAPKS
jgi:hypothetical protein